MKRFYKKAGFKKDGDGFAVILDGKKVRTPGGRTLVLSSGALAEAIADEWNAQSEEVRPEAMPLMRLAATASDRLADNRSAVIRDIVRYAETELLCYRAAHPADLVERQEGMWQPLLDWLHDSHGVRLMVTNGVVPVRQTPDSIEAIHRVIETRKNEELVVLHDLTGVMGSLVLALATVSGRLGAEEAFKLSRLDESYQNEKWGEDAEAALRTEALLDEIRAARHFLSLCRAGL